MAEGEDKDPTEDDRTRIAPREADAQPETIILPKDTEEVPAAPRPDVTPPPSQEKSVPIPPGTMINNNYEIKELISAGGMGEVFRGENAFTGDAVAIKIVLNSLANDEKVAALFMREAKVLCQLSDQAIVRYYNFVKDTNLDRFCLIMEFIDGVSLSEEMQEKGGLSVEACKGLIRRLAKGLDRAHSMEVVHRDLSPDNVILRGGAIDDAVLIDFGIAKSQTNVESTLHGQLAGKFKYISPEQLGHFGGEVGPRTDIYGLGLLIAAAARGKPLDMGTSVVEAVNARQSVPDLSGIDPELQFILTKMLQPDPADRPARMSDVVALLDVPVSQTTVAPPPAGQTTATLQPATLVPGLRQPPGRSAPATTLSGSLEVTGTSASASPFGTTQAPATIAPQTIAPTSQPHPEPKSRVGLVIALLAVLVGGGSYYGWSTGMFAGADATTPPATPTGATEPTETVSGPDTSTREGFLAAWSEEPCVYVTRIASGPNSGVISALSQSVADFDGLADRYDEAFGARPTVQSQEITAEQCPALALADSLRARGGPAPVLTLDNTEMISGGAIVGRLSDRRGRTTWLALISAAGGVYNLTDRLSEGADGSATFSFALQAEAGSEPTPQLLIAIASESPLIAAAAATDGTTAASLLPLIEAEIAGRGGSNAGASIGVFSLSP
ncbi:serine/threonine protein kinase [Cognatiyoonia koreensis]|uniref:Serine/threonine protein kinase n=1 Tax=Cognatiyoonia koreensis TaxID=364200 RepID=A0A1I0RHH6_9RHOB|nr:serine/threonine-protein kinase [Cognatiyoonia koreensis]SEW40126.1 serine/threonine protein kinase [Cognatiyoonia koreensis]